MGLGEAEQLGRVIKQNRRDTEDLREESFASDNSANMLLAPIDRLQVTHEVVGTARFYPDDAFVVSHPVRGDLGNTNYILDKDYAVGEVDYSSTAFSYPGVYLNRPQQLFTYTN